MIDWITAVIPFSHDGESMVVKSFQSAGKTGEVDWSCYKRLKVEGYT